MENIDFFIRTAAAVVYKVEEKEDFSQLYLQNPALMEHLNKKVDFSY